MPPSPFPLGGSSAKPYQFGDLLRALETSPWESRPRSRSRPYVRAYARSESDEIFSELSVEIREEDLPELPTLPSRTIEEAVLRYVG